VSLQNYIDDTRNLIRDQQGLFVDQTTLVGYINEARRQTSLLTDSVRRLITGQPPFGAQATPGSFVAGGAMPGSNPASTFQTIGGQERYPYVGFGNEYLKAQHRGLRSIRDVISVSVSWGGTSRPSLDWMPWEDFQAYLRSNQVLVTNYPSVFSIYNDGESAEVWLYPVPLSGSEMEWDTFCTCADLHDNNDFDAVPHPFRDGVKFYAAGRVYEGSGRFESAGVMFSRFEQSNQLRRGSVDRGKAPTRYPMYR
jgi:hypothetical protein